MIAFADWSMPLEVPMVLSVESEVAPGVHGDPIDVISTGAALGAEVRGIDLRGLDDAAFGRLMQAWHQHSALLVRGQSLSDQELIAFSRRFGDLDWAPVQETGRRFVEGLPEIYIVSNVTVNGQPIGSLGAGEAVWHTDMSYLDVPPMASMLYALEVPPAGGNTSFCSMYAVYEALPDRLKRRIADLKIKHDGTYNSGGYLRQGVTATDDPRKSPGAVHPLVCVHPDTGRRMLYLGRRRNAYLMGLELADSEALLDELWNFVARPEFAWEHVWKVGDLVLWDNRCTMHRRDPFDDSARRIMHRPQIKADLDLSNTQLGLVFSAFAYPYALFQLIGGYFGDKFGARRTLFVSGLIVCAATATTGAVGGIASLFAARLALGIGEGATFPTATRAMAAWVPERNWGFAQGVTHSSARIGNAVTPPLIALLVGLVSWRGAFVVLALLSLVWVFVWLWYFRDVPAAPPLTAEELAELPVRSRGATRPVPWFKLFRRMLPVTAVDFCYGWTLWLFLSWIPSFFYQNYQQSLTQSAFYSAGVFLAGVIGDTLGGVASARILHRTGDRAAARRNVIVAGMLGGFLFLIPVILVHDVNVVAISLAAAFFSVELVVAPIWAVPMDIAPKYSGSASGMMNFGFGVAGIISPFVFGYLIDKTGSWTLPFAGSIGLLLLGAGLAFRMHPERPFEESA